MSLFLAGPGISGYSHATEEAGPSLAQCLRQAEEVIPSKQHQETPVYLGATAGMRLLRYCRASPSSCSTAPGTAMGAQWGPLEQSPCKCCQLTLCPDTLFCRWPLWTPSLPGLFPCLPSRSFSTPTFHHLQHPHAVQRYQEGSSVQADAQGMPRQPPSLVLGLTRDFWSQPCCHSPHTLTKPETIRAKVTSQSCPPLIPICDFHGGAPDLLPGWERELILCIAWEISLGIPEGMDFFCNSDSKEW